MAKKTATLLEGSPTEEVTVNGVDLVLEEPESSVMLDCRSLIGESVSDASKLLLAHARAVRGCLPDEELSDHEAIRLIAMSGGERGELAQKAWRLVGLGNMGGEPRKGDGGEDTPFS